MKTFFSKEILSYALMSAVRDKLIFSIFFIIGLTLSIAIFLGGSAIIEKKEFVSVYTAGGVRVACILGLVLYICFYIRRSFDSRDVDFLLSRPISRVSFVFSHVVAFTVVACVFACLCVLSAAPFAFGLENSFWLWATSIFVEFVIMACASLFFAMVISSATASALITLSFYVLSRLIGQLINIVSSYKVGSIESELDFQIMGRIMEGVSLFVPRLDLMGQTSWLVYEASEKINFGFVIFHGFIFSFFLVVATIIDLQKREF